MLDGLVGELVFQLDGRDGQSVDEQREVKFGVVAGRVAQLPRDRAAVGRVELLQRRREPVLRAKVGQRDLHAKVGDAAAQHVDHAAAVELVAQPLLELLLGGGLIAAVARDQLLPSLQLRRADERE